MTLFRKVIGGAAMPVERFAEGVSDGAAQPSAPLTAQYRESGTFR